MINNYKNKTEVKIPIQILSKIAASLSVKTRDNAVMTHRLNRNQKSMILCSLFL